MRHCFAWLMAFFSLFASTHGQELKRLSLDRTADLGLRIESDSTTKTEGSASIKITTPWSTTVCLGQIDGLQIEDAKLLYRARVKSRLQGDAFLEMWVRLDGKEYFSRGLNSVVAGDADWKTIEAFFLFQKGQKPDRVTLNLIINGSGTVWVDDIVLSKTPLR